ncbi:MAG: VanZ family protein [Rhodocyclaceae bacterium]|nr:VanZ family protein [Rhodocyclaceae bacterium]
MRYTFPGLVALFIFYGSLYPFNFSAAPHNALYQLVADWHLISSRGDILGNIGLFIPWGAACLATVAPVHHMRSAVLVTIGLGLLLALSAQIGQIWVPSRDPALGDVVWNMVGCALGMSLGKFFLARPTSSKPNPGQTQPANVLLVGWLLIELLPLVPSLDIQLIKEHVKDTFAKPELSIGTLAPRAAMTLLAGHLLSLSIGYGRQTLALFGIISFLILGKFLIIDATLNASVVLGFGLGVGAWLMLVRLSPDRRNEVLVFCLFAAYTIGALSPFSLRDTPSSVVWLPFAAMLQGSMLANTQAVLGDLALFAGILYLTRAAGAKPVAISIALAIWVFGMELFQVFIETRTADVTEPLLILLLGKLFSVVSLDKKGVRGNAHREQRQDTSSNLHPKRSPRRLITPLLIRTVIAVALIAALFAIALRLPGIPYNVKELFRGDGNIAALATFALALIWIGAGSVWLARIMAHSRHPGLVLLPATLCVSLISLTLLWSAVTTESIADIAGSSNLFWFVTNRDIWGEFWRNTFLQINTPEAIGFLERCVRYSALYAPLPICLGYMLALREQMHSRSLSFRWLIGLTTGAALTMWLCKAIAFDWSSTDNLNELITRDGEWGLGGGGYLYALLVLLCANGIALAEVLNSTLRRQILVGLASVVAIVIGWWLLNEGLEPHVNKYDLVFSGVQFLLGPDRRHTLTTEVLFFRWSFVQLGGILVIAAGVWLGKSAVQRKHA